MNELENINEADIEAARLWHLDDIDAPTYVDFNAADWDQNTSELEQYFNVPNDLKDEERFAAARLSTKVNEANENYFDDSNEELHAKDISKSSNHGPRVPLSELAACANQNVGDTRLNDGNEDLRLKDISKSSSKSGDNGPRAPLTELEACANHASDGSESLDQNAGETHLDDGNEDLRLKDISKPSRKSGDHGPRAPLSELGACANHASDGSETLDQNESGEIAGGLLIPKVEVEEFHFETDKRIKTHAMETTSDAHTSRQFEADLRHYEEPAKSEAPKKTVPKPFKFVEKGQDVKPKERRSHLSKFVSMAEQLTQFAKKTPDRFRSKPKRDPSPLTKGRRRSISQPGLTVTQSPHLETKERSRPANVKSQAQLEQEEVEKFKKQQFKAAPLNKKILEKVPETKKSAHQPIKQEPFELETDRRAEHWKETHKDKKDENFVFHAQPLRKAILEGPVGVKAAIKLPLTVPESPAFALKKRLRKQLKAPEKLPGEEDNMLVKCRPVPQAGVPFFPKPEHKFTEVQPFTFHEKDLERWAKKEQNMRKLQEEENKLHQFQFHANPVPTFSPEVLPRNAVRTTQPEPFHFTIDERGKKKREKLEEKQVKEEQRRLKEMTHFRAKPSKVLQAEPFVPKKADKLPVDQKPFDFETDKRLEKRLEYEAWQAQKELELQMARKAQQKNKEEEEQADVARLRKQMTTKAQPIKQYKPVEVKPSKNPLTSPHSPKFSNRWENKAIKTD